MTDPSQRQVTLRRLHPAPDTADGLPLPAMGKRQGRGVCQWWGPEPLPERTVFRGQGSLQPEQWHLAPGFKYPLAREGLPVPQTSIFPELKQNVYCPWANRKMQLPPVSQITGPPTGLEGPAATPPPSSPQRPLPWDAAPALHSLALFTALTQHLAPYN